MSNRCLIIAEAGVNHNGDLEIARKLIEIANRDNIDIQLEVCSGDTGTDAWEIQVSGKGIPSSLISIPVRYMHANYEIADTDDLENTAKLICAFASSLKEGDCLCW